MAAPPIAGQWSRDNVNPADYTGAQRWGTGISPIYGQYGIGPPLAITGRNDEQIPYSPVPPYILAEPGLEYGYTMEDIPMGAPDEFMVSEIPSPDELPETTRMDSGRYPPPSLMARPNGPSGTYFRTIHQPGMLEAVTEPASYHTETVSEGWENKQHGEVLTADTSAQSQYERQTSMQQVNPAPGRNNALAVERGTDDVRHNIMTRLTGMKIKPWSEGERLQDMFPFQQDLILRPFWFRNAATGKVEWMKPNAFAEMLPIQRNPPPEPDYGPNESIGSDVPSYGYTPEDVHF